MVGLDQKFEEKKLDGEDSVMESEVGPVNDETAETEVDLRLPIYVELTWVWTRYRMAPEQGQTETAQV